MIFDVHLDATPAEQRVTHLLGTLFEVDLAEVRMLPSYEEMFAHGGSSVLCIARARPGAFPRSLEIIVTAPTDLSGEEVASRFAREFQCACLITSDASNPYLWTLITREGEMFQADVDEEALGREELRVVRILHGGGAA
jgi:hypothetical protein